MGVGIDQLDVKKRSEKLSFWKYRQAAANRNIIVWRLSQT